MGRRRIAASVVWLWACAPAEGGPSPVGTDGSSSSGSGSGSGTGIEASESTEGEFSASVSATAIPTSGSGSDPSAGSGEATGDAGCAGIESESAHCLVTDGTRVRLVGLDSGSVCTLADLDQAFGASSLAWTDDALVGCDDAELVLRRADLATGEVASFDVTCQAIANHADGLLLLPSTTGSPELYASVDAIVSGSATEVFEIEPAAARITVAGNLLYSAWHTTQAVQAWDLATSAHVMDVMLEAFDDWVFGMSVVDGRLFMLGSPEDLLLHEYDAASGARVQELPLPDLESPQGLACR